MIRKCSICKRVSVTDKNEIWQPFREQWPIDEPKDIVFVICPSCAPVDGIRRFRIEDTGGILHP